LAVTVRKLSAEVYRYCTALGDYHASIVIQEPIMHPRSWPESLALSAGQTKSFVFAEPMQVHIVHGCVWLTVSGMPDDFWMADGEFIDVPAQRQIVIEAHKTDSVLELNRLMKDVRGRLPVKSPLCAEFGA
jgi:hypothetical protein